MKITQTDPHTKRYIYQDNHPELRAIATALKQKVHEQKLELRSLANALNIESWCSLSRFIDGAGIDDKSLEEIKEYIGWQSSDTDKYLKLYQQQEDERQRKQELDKQKYYPQIPDGELEAREKDSSRWERTFSGEYPW